MLTKELAETIVRETMERLNRNINIFDADGIVLASGDPERIGQLHEAALEAIRRNRTYVVGEDHTGRWRGSQAGINLPVVYDGNVVGAVGITGRPDEVQPFGELVKMTAELLLRQQQSELQRNWKQFVADRVADELLEGATAPLSELNGRLRPLLFTLRPPYQVATIRIASPAPGGEANSLLPDSLSRRLAGDALVCRRHDREWALVFANRTPGHVEEVLERLLRAENGDGGGLAIGLGTGAEQLRLIPDSHQESLAILKLTPKREAGLFRYEDRAWEAVIAEITAASKRKMIGKYKRHLPPKAQDTLDCFFRCGMNIAEAAQRLGIHRNTLSYRLEQIKTDTGCDPHRFRDALTLQLVLWLMKQAESEEA